MDESTPLDDISETPEHLTLCGICQDKLKDPKQLKCLHYFCMACITKLKDEHNENPEVGPLEGNGKCCPTCHIGPLVSRLQDDLFVNSMLEVLKTKANAESPIVCAEHPSLSLNLYCANCRVTICENCWSYNHTDCEVIAPPIDDLWQDVQEKQEIAKEDLGYMREDLEDICQDLLYEQHDSNAKKDEIKTAVKEHFGSLREKLQRALAQQEEKLLQKVEDSFHENQNIEMDKLAWCRSMLSQVKEKDQLIEMTNITADNKPNEAVALLQTFTSLQRETVKTKWTIDKFKPSKFDIQLNPNQEKQNDLLTAVYADVVAADISTVEFTDDEDEYFDDRDNYRDDNIDGGDNREHENDASEYEEPPPPYSEVKDIGRPAAAENARLDLPLKYAEYRNTFQALLPDDKHSGYIVGLSWLDDEKIIMADRWNKRLKVFTCTGNLKVCMPLAAGDPWDIDAMATRTRANQPRNAPSYCLVTVPSAKVILKIMITAAGDRIEIRTSIPTFAGYTSLKHNPHDTPNTIVCGLCSPFGKPRVEIISMTGRILRIFEIDSGGRQLFSDPRSIDLITDDEIAICDWNWNRVVFLRKDGFIVGAYSGTRDLMLKDPMGTAIDCQSHLMIADKKSHCIHIVSNKGVGMGKMVFNKRLSEPREIGISTGQNTKMAITFGSGSVQVFDLFDYQPVSRTTRSTQKDSSRSRYVEPSAPTLL